MHSFVCLQCFQPKPILLEKQFSEPSSPIKKDFDPIMHQQQQQQQMEHQQHQSHAHGSQQDQKRPPMHRGYSDLGNRIKKRVTLRYVLTTLVCDHFPGRCCCESHRIVSHWIFLCCSSSSMPSQYVDNNSGDVVIMVPAIEPDQSDSIMVGGLDEQSVCIDTEDADVEPSSPKAMTESSSKSNLIVVRTQSISDSFEDESSIQTTNVKY